MRSVDNTLRCWFCVPHLMGADSAAALTATGQRTGHLRHKLKATTAMDADEWNFAAGNQKINICTSLLLGQYMYTIYPSNVGGRGV